MTCPTNLRGEYIARDLVEDQTLENLDRFGARLERAHEMLKANRANKAGR